MYLAFICNNFNSKNPFFFCLHNTPSSSSSVTDIVMEEAPTIPTLAPPLTTTRPTITTLNRPMSGSMRPANVAIAHSLSPLPPPPPPPQPQPERDSRRSGGGRLGLTKEVLSAHTQQEEQAFLDRFKDLSKLRVFDQTASSTVRYHTPAALSRGRHTHINTAHL